MLAGPAAPNRPAPVAADVAADRARQPFGTRATSHARAVTQQQQQQQQQDRPARPRRRRAEPHRRVAVLDGPVLRTGRVHRAHPRRVLARAARGPPRRRHDRVPRSSSKRWACPSTISTSTTSTRRCSLRCWPTTCGIRARSSRSLDAVVGQRPRCSGGDLLGDVGEHQHDASAAEHAPGRERRVRPARVPRVGARSRGDAGRASPIRR